MLFFFFFFFSFFIEHFRFLRLGELLLLLLLWLSLLLSELLLQSNEKYMQATCKGNNRLACPPLYITNCTDVHHLVTFTTSSLFIHLLLPAAIRDHSTSESLWLRGLMFDCPEALIRRREVTWNQHIYLAWGDTTEFLLGGHGGRAW